MSEKPTVLIVDDNDNLRRGLELSLSRTYDMRSVASGEEAIQLLKGSFRPDVVLADYNLPEPLKGEAFLLALQSVGALRIGVITGDDSLDENVLKQKGVGGVVHKGDVEDIVSACAKLIQDLLKK